MDFGSWGEGLVEAIGELVGDVFGDVLSGWVEDVEGRNGVEVVVGEWVADFNQDRVDGVEVAEQAVGVERVAGDGGDSDEVVAVDWFLGSQNGDGVCGAELVGDLDGEHYFESCASGGAG